MNTKSFLPVILVVAALFFISTCLYTVQQGQHALRLRLGKLTLNAEEKAVELQPGLHVKAPFIDKIQFFDTRLQTLDNKVNRVFTVKQKPIMIDYFAKWRITNLATYYKRTGGFTMRAQQILTQQINDALRAAIGKRTLKAVVTSDRGTLMALLSQIAKGAIGSLGITVTDVRIRGIELPNQVRERIYNAMITKRQKISTYYRYNGKAEKTKIESKAYADYVKTVAQANAKAQLIRAKGDSIAANIYRLAYDKNKKFYAFYRSLQAYKGVFTDKRSIMVLKPNSKFFKYFNKVSPST